MSLTKNKIYIVYRLISPSNKSYIGVTSCGFKTRLKQHIKEAEGKSTKPIHNAIRKYGFENFKTEIIAQNMGYEIVCEMEKAMIKYYNCKNPFGYNLTDGGDGVIGHFHSEEVKKVLSLKAKKQWGKMDDISKFAKANKFRAKGHEALVEKFKNMAPEEKQIFKEKVSKGCKKYWSSEAGKAKKNLIKKPHSEATKEKIRISLIKYRTTPEIREKVLKDLGAKKIICIETGIIYESQSQAETTLKINNINHVLKGKRQRAGGYHWRYYE